MHSKLKINSTATTTLILIILSSLTLSFAAATTTNVENTTTFLFSLVRNANTTVTETYNRLEANATAIPQESSIAYNQALLLANEAESQLQIGNISDANTKAIQALQKFKEALRIIYEAVPEQPTEAELILERTVALQSAIDRSYEQLQRLENLTSFAATTGYNTTILEARIEAIKALLANASLNLNQKNFEAALNSTTEAKTFIENLLSHVSTLAVTLKIQRLNSYVNQTRVRLAELRTEATATQNAASLTALNSADASLATAEEYLVKKQINETLNALTDSKADEEKAAAYLNPTDSVTSSPTPTPKPSPTQSPSTTDKVPTKTPSSTSATNTTAATR